MAANSIYLVKQFMTYLGQNMLNVYAYEQVAEGSVTDALGMWEVFDTEVLSNWKFCVSDDVLVANLEVLRILQPTDFKDGIGTITGGGRVIANAQLMPAFVSFSLRSNRNGAGTRRSYKRYSGISDSDVDGNALTAAFLALTAVTDLTQKLGQVLTHAGGSSYKPIQIAAGWILSTLVTRNFDLINWDVPTLTSQVSRK